MRIFSPAIIPEPPSGARDRASGSVRTGLPPRRRSPPAWDLAAAARAGPPSPSSRRTRCRRCGRRCRARPAGPRGHRRPSRPATRCRQRHSSDAARQYTALTVAPSTNTPWWASSARSASPIARPRPAAASALLTAAVVLVDEHELPAATGAGLVVDRGDALMSDHTVPQRGWLCSATRRRGGPCAARGAAGCRAAPASRPRATLPSRSMRITSSGRTPPT